MSWLSRLTNVFRTERIDSELDEEQRFHLDARVEDLILHGMAHVDAEREARRRFGNPLRLREESRDIRLLPWLDSVKQDVRYAIRTLFKYRAVSAFAVVSLALGIGAGTAIFSFLDAILLRSLPVTDPTSLVQIAWRSKPFNFGSSGKSGSEFVLRSISGSFYRDETGVSGRIFPFPAFEQLQQVSSPMLSNLFGYYRAGNLNVLVDGQAQLSAGQYVSGDFFSGLAVVPAAGRLIAADDDRAAAAPVTVLSHGYSEQRFGSASNAVGRAIRIDNVPFTVIGVTPREFFGVDQGTTPSLYLPLRTNALLDPEAARRFIEPNYYWMGIMGRLRPGITLAQAESALAPVFARWVAPTASNDGERANVPTLQVIEGGSGLDTLRRRYSRPLYLLLALVALILVIACANTANLLLARGTARRREIALRLSIGAGRARLVRQLLTESIVLASISGVLGILIAFVGTPLLTALLANGAEGLTVHAEVNSNVLAVAIGLSVLCGVLFGLAPAIQLTRPTLMPALRDTPITQSRTRRKWSLRLGVSEVLVLSQVSLVLLLLLAASLFARTLSNLQTIFLGFNPENVLLFELNAPQAGYAATNAITFYSELRRRLAEIPGVRAATLSHASLIRAGRGHPVSVDGVPATGTRFLQTGPGFFSTMQIPILQGREFDERDGTGTLPVAVISESFAQSFFPNQNPLGRQIKVGGSNPMTVEVVGVAAMARYGGLKAVIPPVLYAAYPQIPPANLQQMTYAIRTESDPMHYVSTVRRIVTATDAGVPITNIRTQSAEIDQTINLEIVLARLATVFAVSALVIACVGLYGTMNYAVARRTKEIGIRMALGAPRTGVIWMVLREVCVPAALGLAIAIPIARGTSPFIASFLFNTTPSDPRALVVALTALLLAALVASYGPARRATHVEPISALRED